MRARGSGAVLQLGKTQMRHGISDGEAARNGCARDCHVNCGAEPPQDPACAFAALGTAAQLVNAARKIGCCSVDISYTLFQPLPRLLRFDSLRDIIVHRQT